MYGTCSNYKSIAVPTCLSISQIWEHVLTITFSIFAAQTFKSMLELTTISHNKLNIMLWCSGNVLYGHYTSGGKKRKRNSSKTEAKFHLFVISYQRKRTASTISTCRLCVSLDISCTKSLFKYSSNCARLLGAPKTPARSTGITHIIASLSITELFGLKPASGGQFKFHHINVKI